VISIDPNSGRATAIVMADIPPSAAEQVLAMAGPTLDLFARPPGFVSAALHVSTDRARLITHLQWQREEDHWNCLRSPDLAPSPALDIAKLDARLFDLLGTRD
jgi:hypothetical protein